MKEFTLLALTRPAPGDPGAAGTGFPWLSNGNRTHDARRSGIANRRETLEETMPLTQVRVR